MNYSCKEVRNRKVVNMCRTRSKRRFLKNLRSLNWENGQLKVLLRVSYGIHPDNIGKMTNFVNEGEYENKKNLWRAFNAFTEK